MKKAGTGALADRNRVISCITVDDMAFAQTDRDGIRSRAAADVTAVAFCNFYGIVPSGAGHGNLIVFYGQRIGGRSSCQRALIFLAGFSSHKMFPPKTKRRQQ